MMAYSLREVGRDKEAEEGVIRVSKSLGNNASSFFELARYQARGAQRLAAAAGDSRSVAALESAALDALRKAVSLGFSDKLALQNFGQTFQLHDRPEFRLILLDAIFPSNPFASTPPLP